jgi:hypothetical protein
MELCSWLSEWLQIGTEYYGGIPMEAVYIEVK